MLPMARVLREYPLAMLKPEDLSWGLLTEDGRVDFARVFGRPGPVHIEIGCGKATFLVNESRVRPDVNFLGIERANKYYRYAVDRIGRWGLTNVRIIRTDAASFLADLLTNDCVDCFHIYFPDPWPKKRHHKRRFLNEANFQQLLRCLKTGGQLRIATDHPDYFRQIKELVDNQRSRLEEIEFVPAAGAESGELTGTNYERKYIKDRRQIYTIALKRS
jgi:tRNA (guanine-N7-)-methyltransferase